MAEPLPGLRFALSEQDFETLRQLLAATGHHQPDPDLALEWPERPPVTDFQRSLGLYPGPQRQSDAAVLATRTPAGCTSVWKDAVSTYVTSRTQAPEAQDPALLGLLLKLAPQTGALRFHVDAYDDEVDVRLIRTDVSVALNLTGAETTLLTGHVQDLLEWQDTSHVSEHLVPHITAELRRRQARHEQQTRAASNRADICARLLSAGQETP